MDNMRMVDAQYWLSDEIANSSLLIHLAMVETSCCIA